MFSPAAAAADMSCVSEPVASDTTVVRIVIVDDYPIFRDGLRRLLETAGDLRVVGDTDAVEAIAMVRTLRPDILLLGGSAAVAASLQAVQQIIAGGVPVKVILLAKSADEPGVEAALQFGAHGVLPRDATPEALFKSITSVMAGHCWVGRECVADLAAGVRRLDHTSRHTKAFGLTHRELEIVRAIMSGDTNKAIARRLSISENTVKRHITHIFNKVGASTRVELALFAAHHNLV